MKRIRLFESFVEESYLSGSRAPLYHSSTMFMSPNILREDSIRDLNGNGISFTRDKNFIYNECPVTFVVDGDAIKNLGKSRQFDYYNKIDSRTKNKSVEFESEEILHGDIIDLHKYLIAIRLNSYIKIYKDSPKNTMEEYYEAYEDFMLELEQYTEKFGVKVLDPLGVQHRPTS